MDALPIDAYIADIVSAVRARRAVVLSAAPGAGKTTRLPPALAEDGRTIVLQPRRVAARAMARRVAEEQRWTIGREVGWHVRFEQKFTPQTRIVFATEGILTARLQQDPLLADFRTIVLDEFHERSIHADLGLALARQAWRARDDLRVVVMSATLDTARVAAALDDCPVIAVPGRLHPLEIDYRPGQPLPDAVREVMTETTGSVLCFLPGAPEINRVRGAVAASAPDGTEVLPLHGSLPADEQDRAIARGSSRRVILATNIAETSLTVPGITAVIDTGLQKVARFDPDRGIDSLEVERIPLDSADQRAGRAGRETRGRVRRLWAQTDRLRSHGEADVHRIDLSDTVLDILAWGGDPLSFEWFDPPSLDRIQSALALLEQLGAVVGGKVTDIGGRMKRLPLHPRLARMLIESGGSEEIALACALLSERHAQPRQVSTTDSDLLSAIEDRRALPPHVREVARRIAELARAALPDRPDSRQRPFLRAVFSGYRDRVAKRREDGSSRFLLASGHGAVLGRDSGVRHAEFIVAVDVQAGKRGEGSEATVRLASAIDPAWLEPTDIKLEHLLVNGRVRALERTFYGAVVLTERPAEPDAEASAELLAAAYRARGWREEDAQLLRRLRFAGASADENALLLQAASGARTVDDIQLRDAVGWSMKQDLDRLAPESLIVPSGRAARLTYQDDGTVMASVKLQELFGLAESPRLGPRHTPVVFELLAPNGRAVQTTRDLRNFWDTTYADVRKELRGRYPRHPWPEDPWSATATHRAKPRGGSR